MDFGENNRYSLCCGFHPNERTGEIIGICCDANGSQNLNWVPLPGPLSTSISPPWASTIPFAMAKPSPARHVKSGIGLTQLGMGPEKYDFEGTGPAELQNIAFTEIINSAG